MTILINLPLRFALLFVAPLLICGCDYRSTRQPVSKTKTGTSGAQTQYRTDVLRSAMSMLNAPERFDDEDKTDKQIVEQLVQWSRMVRDAKAAKADSVVKWEIDPLVESLPESIRRSRNVRQLGSESFDDYDGQFLREAALLRDVAKSIQTAKPDDLSKAAAFFDWTVSNIEIQSPPLEDATPAEKWLALHTPHETLFYGRGTPLARAWVFMLLARQMGLDTVLLAVPDSRNPDQPRPWAVGLVSGDDIYLFDYAYGLPIPGPGGKGIATLEQAATDESVLRQMDIPGGRIYPRKAADLEETIVLLEASPGYLSQRMKQLESHLTGRDRMVLTANPSKLAAHLKGMKHVAEIRLWTMPYEVLAERQKLFDALEDELSPDRGMALTLLREMQLERFPFTLPVAPEEKKRSRGEDEDELKPESREEIRRRQRSVLALRLGRLLHLRGQFGGTQDAASEDDVSEIVQLGAKHYYLRAIATKQELDEINRMMREGFEFSPGRPITKELVDARQQMSDDARYWLGLIWLAQGKDGYENVEQFLRPLADPDSDNLWSNGARYNLARSYEALDKLAEAIKLYEADKSPQRYGNRLRADRLKTKSAEKGEK